MAEVLNRLLAEGCCDYVQGVVLEDMNELLRPMGYAAFIWPYKSKFILKDLSEPGAVQLPWTEATVDDAKVIVTKIALREDVRPSSTLSLLIQEGWIKMDPTSRQPVLTERALVQFSEFLLLLNGRYRKCGLCEFLADSADYHPICSEMAGLKRASTIVPAHRFSE